MTGAAVLQRAGAAVFSALLLLVSGAVAQERIDITRGNVEPMPIAIPDYIGDGELQKLGEDIRGVIVNDLYRSGLFAPIDKRAYIQELETIHERPRFPDWRVINAQVLVAGEVIRLEDGRIQVNTRVWDVFADEQISAVAFKTLENNWRRAAHKVSDQVYEALTGESGYFDTRVVFIHETGPKIDRVKRLMIMDQDGANPQALTNGEYLVLTPRFSPNQQQITYLSYRNRVPSVFLFNIETGQQEALGQFQGMTFAPRFSADGEKIVFSQEINGNSDVYLMDLRTRRTRRLTYNPAIDTSPSMSPDGRYITFASDRGGTQQIYVMEADGSNPRRITFGDGRYGTPVWSPRGDLIAFTRQNSGKFNIGVIRPDGVGERILTESFLDEGPSWAPNGRVIMFFREYPTNRDGSGGGAELWSVDLTGYNLRQVVTPGDASDPAWSPLLP
ncbi:MAG: Tol-Pal system beta propeller repeat protein TolB [Pseudomonadota bacterium]